VEDLESIRAKVGSALLHRFESDMGYRDFPETIECLTRLRELGVKISVVSNADPRILNTMKSLSILDLLSHPPTLSWDAEASKPSPLIFQKACVICQEEIGEGVIMVGDELKADYHGAINAGIEARLIRRPGEWSDGAVRQTNEEVNDVHVIKTLEEVVGEVRRRNRYG